MDDIEFTLAKDGKSATVECKGKQKVIYTIHKELGGFIFYNIKSTKTLGRELEGRFSSIPAAYQKIQEYLRNKPVSNTIKRQEYAEDLKERLKKESNGSKTSTKGRQ